MDTSVLEKIGFSRAEIKVYSGLLALGLTTVGPLTKKSEIPSSNIYPILENLIEKGLASYSITANKKYFKAEDPNRLKDLLDEKKKQLDSQEIKLLEIISELSSMRKKKEEKQEYFIYEKIKGVKTALESVLKTLDKGDTFYVVDASRISNDKLMGYFNDFHKRRAKKGIKYQAIYGTESLEFAKERKEYAHTKVRVLPKDVKIPSVFWIFKEYVVIAVFSEHPIALRIKNKHISEGFMANFNMLWKISKEI